MAKLWGLIGQMLSSVTNLTASIVAAATLETVEFGYYFVLQTAFLLVLGMSRGAVGEILLFSVGDSADEQTDQTSLRSDALRFYLLIGASVGIIGGLLIWAFLPVENLHIALLFAMLLPLLLLQDFGRYAAFSLGRYDVATLSDAAWLVLLLIFLVITRSSPTLTTVFGSWALSGSIAGLLILGRYRLGLSRGSARRWWTTKRTDSSRLAAEYMLVPICRWALVVFVSVLVGAETVGLFRKAEVLFGPFVVLSLAAHVVFGPLLREGPQNHPQYVKRASAAFAAVLLGWWLALRVGLLGLYNELVAGDTPGDEVTITMITILSVVVLGRSWQGAYITSLRSSGNTRGSLRVSAISAGVGSVAGAILALTYGPLGIAVGLGTGYLAGGLIGQLELLKPVNENYGSSTDTRPLQSKEEVA